jgi:nitroreductase
VALLVKKEVMSEQSAYQKRFGAYTEDSKYPPNDFIQKVLGRSTIRGFKDQPLEEGQLELLVAAAQSAASSGMLQTWSVIALTDKESKERLLNTERALGTIGGVDSYNTVAIRGCSVFLIWLADLHRADSILKAHAEERNIDPDLLLQTSRAEYHLKAIIDATIAAQTFSLAAESQGLGVMYCGAVRQLSADHFIENFNLPPLTFPIFGMAIGHPLDERYGLVKARLPTSIVLHHDSYKPFTDMSRLTEYNKIHKKYSGSFHLVRKDYVERLIERMAVSFDKKNVANSLKQMGFDFK